MRSHYRFPRDYDERPIWLEYDHSFERFYRWLYNRVDFKTGMISKSISAYALYSRLTVEQVRTAMKALSEPNPRAINQKYQGRLIEVDEDGVTILVLDFLDDQTDTESINSTERRRRFDLRNPGRKHHKIVFETDNSVSVGDTQAKPGIAACAVSVGDTQKVYGKTVKEKGANSTAGKSMSSQKPVCAVSVGDTADVPRGTLNEVKRSPGNQLTNKRINELTNSSIAPTDSPIGESSVEANEKSFATHGKVNGKAKGALAGQREIEKIVLQPQPKPNQSNPPSTDDFVEPVCYPTDKKRLQKKLDEVNAQVNKAAKERKERLLASTGPFDRELFSLDDPVSREKKKNILTTEHGSEFFSLKLAITNEIIRSYYVERSKVLDTDPWVKHNHTMQEHAFRIARFCLWYAVPLEKLIAFWLSKREMTHQYFPSLPHMGAPTSIDRAVAELVPLQNQPAIPKHKPANGKVGSKTDFSSEDLHPEMRACLKAGGHNVRNMTDRDLISIQNYARQLARGIASEESIRDLDYRRLVKAAKILFQQTN